MLQLMHCSSHGHRGMDCCKTMPKMHGPFLQLSSGQGISVSPIAVAVESAPVELQDLKSSARAIAAQCNAPPDLCAASPLPLRI
jgi:hypothetical protein